MNIFPVFTLSPFMLIIINILAWGFIHICISLLLASLPLRLFIVDSPLYRTRKWENNGELWQRLFKVKQWKHKIPDGTHIISKGYEKQHLQGVSLSELEIFLYESRRAELTHWLSIPPACLFFIWNPLWAGWIMIAYALLFNLPIIIVQRYNRPRLQRLIALKKFR